MNKEPAVLGADSMQMSAVSVGSKPQRDGYSGGRVLPKSNRAVRVLLVDDHPIVRRGLSAFLSTYPHLTIVGEAVDGLEALRQARELAPDVIVMDIDLPLMNGLAATECICRKFHDIKVLMLSMHSSPEYATRAIQSGAYGFILKQSPCEELVKAIDIVHRGGTYFSGDIVWFAMRHLSFRDAVRKIPDLSERQIEVLICIVAGKENKEIAEYLKISVRTVESHRAQLMRRLSVHTAVELTRYALNKGLVSLNQSSPVSILPDLSVMECNPASALNVASVPTLARLPETFNQAAVVQ